MNFLRSQIPAKIVKSIKVRIVFRKSDTIAIIRNRHEANPLNGLEIVKVIVLILAGRIRVIVIIQEIDPVHHDEITEITEIIAIIGTIGKYATLGCAENKR